MYSITGVGDAMPDIAFSDPRNIRFCITRLWRYAPARALVSYGYVHRRNDRCKTAWMSGGGVSFLDMVQAIQRAAEIA